MAEKLKTSPKKIKSWLLNKIKAIHRIGKPITTKIRRNIHLAGIILFFLMIIASFFYPLSPAQQIKKQLLANPWNFDHHLKLAEIFLEDHQFKQAGQALLLAQAIKDRKPDVTNKTDLSLEKLWEEKQANDPQDIKELITLWEGIVAQRPDYRDGYLQLAVLNYKVFEDKKAQDYLKKALVIDPNFVPALELKKIIPLF
jgi:tetratricopeptide (TPR) repeat protein